VRPHRTLPPRRAGSDDRCGRTSAGGACLSRDHKRPGASSCGGSADPFLPWRLSPGDSAKAERRLSSGDLGHGRVDIQVGTLSKAIGVLGGYVCGSRALIDFLYQRARPFLFSTSHPPSVAASCLAAFDILEREPERIQQLWDNTKYFKAGLLSVGFNTGISETPITPVIVGEAAKAHELSRELFNEGVLATGIGFPTVAKDRARVRTIVTATHTRDELDRALDVFSRVGKRMGLIS
jgi:glycine C-acetyltransferase